MSTTPVLSTPLSMSTPLSTTPSMQAPLSTTPALNTPSSTSMNIAAATTALASTILQEAAPVQAPLSTEVSAIRAFILEKTATASKEARLARSVASASYLTDTGLHLEIAVGSTTVRIPKAGSTDTQFLVFNNKAEDVSCRTVPMEGQYGRIAMLLELAENAAQNGGQIRRLATSLSEYQTTSMTAHVWNYDEAKKGEGRGAQGIHSRTQTGHVFQQQMELAVARRENQLASMDHVIVTVARGTQAEVSAQIDAILDRTASEDEAFLDGSIDTVQVRRHEGFAAAFQKQLIPYYTGQGYHFMGGNPDTGTAVFLKHECANGVTSMEARQRLIKMLLRSGIQLKHGQPISARLVDFNEGIEAGTPGYRDGVYMVLRQDVANRMWLEPNGLKAKATLQGHHIDLGSTVLFPNGDLMSTGAVTASKGLMYLVGKDCQNQELKDLLGNQNAVLDFGTYAKIFGAGTNQVGDIVSILPEHVWVMEADVYSDTKEISVSNQLMARSPKALRSYWAEYMETKIAAFLSATHAADKRPLLAHAGSFGEMGKLARIGAHPIMGYDIDTKDYVAKSMYFNMVWSEAGYMIRKGVKHAGASARLVHDSSLPVDCGDQRPGVRVPESWGLAVGELFVYVAYPALPAYDAEGRAATIFVCEVVDVHQSPTIEMNSQNCLWALRDEDGDMGIALFISQDAFTPAMAACGQAHVEVSAKDKSGNAGKVDAFSAQVTGDILADSIAAYKVYERLGAMVGIVDNLATSIMLYVSPEVLRSTDTPTGETGYMFISKCIQATIEGMKHITLAVYSHKSLQAWARQILPQYAFENGDREKGAIISHPELLYRKPKVTGRTPMLADHAFEARKIEKGNVRTGVWYRLTSRLIHAGLSEDGFVTPEHYAAPAATIVYVGLESLFADPVRAAVVSELGDDIVAESKKIARSAHLAAVAKMSVEVAASDKGKKAALKAAMDAQRLYFEDAGMTVRRMLSEVEFQVVQAAVVANSGMSFVAALGFCEEDFLSVVVKAADAGLEAADVVNELGLVGTAPITSSVDFDAIADVRAALFSGILRMRVYGKNGMGCTLAADDYIVVNPKGEVKAKGATGFMMLHGDSKLQAPGQKEIVRKGADAVAPGFYAVDRVEANGASYDVFVVFVKDAK